MGIVIWRIIYLRIEREVKQFEVFQERSFESMPLDKERLPRADVVDDGAHNCLLRVADCVVDVDQRVPVLTPIHRFRVLHNTPNTSDRR